MLETFAIGFGCAVDIEVIGVGGGDDGNPRAQPMKRTVVLVGFGNGDVTFVGQQQVGAVVFEYPAQKRVTIHRRLPQQVCNHARYGGFSVRSGNTNGVACFGYLAQHLRAFHQGETVLPKVLQLAVRGGNGGGVNDQRTVFIQKFVRNKL